MYIEKNRTFPIFKMILLVKSTIFLDTSYKHDKTPKSALAQKGTFIHVRKRFSYFNSTASGIHIFFIHVLQSPYLLRLYTIKKKWTNRKYQLCRLFTVIGRDYICRHRKSKDDNCVSGPDDTTFLIEKYIARLMLRLENVDNFFRTYKNDIQKHMSDKTKHQKKIWDVAFFVYSFVHRSDH